MPASLIFTENTEVFFVIQAALRYPTVFQAQFQALITRHLYETCKNDNAQILINFL